MRPRWCPVCGERGERGTVRPFGIYEVHRRCTPLCGLCRKVIEPPGVGRGADVKAWCGELVHAACKNELKETIRGTTGPLHHDLPPL